MYVILQMKTKIYLSIDFIKRISKQSSPHCQYKRNERIKNFHNNLTKIGSKTMFIT